MIARMITCLNQCLISVTAYVVDSGLMPTSPGAIPLVTHSGAYSRTLQLQFLYIASLQLTYTYILWGNSKLLPLKFDLWSFKQFSFLYLLAHFCFPFLLFSKNLFERTHIRLALDNWLRILRIQYYCFVVDRNLCS